jgi:hypothetical protein
VNALNVALMTGTAALAWIAPFELGQGRRAQRFRPVLEGPSATREVHLRRQPVAAVGIELGDARFTELGEALVQHARRHGVAARLERPERDGSDPELPEDAQRPAPAEQIEDGHDRPAGP